MHFVNKKEYNNGYIYDEPEQLCFNFESDDELNLYRNLVIADPPVEEETEDLTL